MEDDDTHHSTESSLQQVVAGDHHQNHNPNHQADTMIEVTREEAWSSFLTDDELCDFELEGTDGMRLPANRYVLAARSNVFRTMLLGGFLEAKSPVVKVGYEGRVLRAVVEYILTDKAELLQAKPPSLSESPLSSEDDSKNIRRMVFLTAAALYFDLPGLCQLAKEKLEQWLWGVPSLAFVALESCKQAGPSVPLEIEELALTRIRSNAKSLLNADAVACLSRSVLEAIIQDDKLEMDEYQLFEILQLWATTTNTITETTTTTTTIIITNDGDTTTPPASQNNATNNNMERRLIASELVQHIHLEWIDPTLLSTSVANSGLVSQQHLFEAFKQQALAAHERYGIAFQRPRYTQPVWLSSLSDTLSAENSQREESLLRYAPMTSGVHQWTISIEERCYETFLGVASCNTVVDPVTWLGRQEHCWMYGADGKSHNSRLSWGGNPRFVVGSKVTFTLDLLPDAHGRNGTLTASVDGGPTFSLFQNMRASLDAKLHGGFVPAASLRFNGRVRLLDIHQLEK